MTSHSSLLFPRSYQGAQGLAEDVRYYGQWMRDEAEKRIGHLYPKIAVWLDPRSGRYFGEADVGKWRSREERGERSESGEQTARECGHSTLSSHQLTVIAWLWARTVKSPNPAFANVDVPLASTFMLSTKAGKEAYVEVVREEERGERASHPAVPLASHSSPLTPHPGYRFTVKTGKPKKAEGAKNGTKLARGANFKCLMSDSPMTGDYIKAEGKAGRMGARLMAIVAEGTRGRVYLAPTPEHEAVALKAKPHWRPESPLPDDPRNFWTVQYGLATYGDLFTPRQLVALTGFSDLVGEAIEKIKRDALEASREGRGVMCENAPLTPRSSDLTPLAEGGAGATAYAEAVGVYLAFALSKMTDLANTIVTWRTDRESSYHLFSRQAIPMSWDYCELNTLLKGTGSYDGAAKWTAESIEGVAAGYGSSVGGASQQDAQTQEYSKGRVISTDPPYYDNIGYADLSDFFYVWLRRSLRPVFPDLFATMAVPKAEELVATPYRHGSKEKAETFFLNGMTQAMHRLAEQAHPAYPVTIYYAFKQSESGGDGTTNTGWDTFLAAVIEAGFAISGTWPMRTELSNRMIGSGTNALASSIVLVCRPRPANAPTATRRDFLNALKTELPAAIRILQGISPTPGSPPPSHSSLLSPHSSIAPVDLAQAAIGPGMAVYTRFARVLDAEGQPLPVRAALALINQVLDEALAEQEGDFDADTRWALAWFEQFGFEEGEYGVAEQLSKAKNTAVSGLAEAGIVFAGKGKVRLLKPAELPADWDPSTDTRLTVWESAHQLIRVLEAGGEAAAATLLAKLGSQAEIARELCYRLYTLCERKKRAVDAMAYNALVQSWPEIVRLAREKPRPATPGSKDLFE